MHKALLILSVIASGLFIANDANAKKSEESSGNMEYVKMDPLMLPIIDNDGVYQVLSMVVVIEVGGINDADKVKAKKFHLNDAYIQDMYGILNEHAALKGGIVQVNIIKERLNYITDEIMSEDHVETEVLLQVVQQRPI